MPKSAEKLKEAVELKLGARRDEYKRMADEAHAARSYDTERDYRTSASVMSEALVLVSGVKPG